MACATCKDGVSFLAHVYDSFVHVSGSLEIDRVRTGCPGEWVLITGSVYDL